MQFARLACMAFSDERDAALMVQKILLTFIGLVLHLFARICVTTALQPSSTKMDHICKRGFNSAFCFNLVEDPEELSNTLQLCHVVFCRLMQALPVWAPRWSEANHLQTESLRVAVGLCKILGYSQHEAGIVVCLLGWGWFMSSHRKCIYSCKRIVNKTKTRFWVAANEQSPADFRLTLLVYTNWETEFRSTSLLWASDWWD